MVWVNPDGLVVRFPGDDRIVHGGEYPGAGTLREIEVEFDAADITTTPAILDYNIIIPSNSVIQEVVVISEVPVSGGAATGFDFGLKRLDATTELDHDGLVNDILSASLSEAGEQTTLTAADALAGALVGTETTRAGLFCANTNGGTYTAGHVVLKVKLYVKDAAPVPTLVD